MTLAEIQEICYLLENEQTPQKILGFNNIPIIHGMLLTINIRPSLNLCLKENYLVYITTPSYAMHQLRIRFSLEQLKITKKEEVFFTGVKTDTKVIFDDHPENLKVNVFLRVQAQKSFSSSDNLLRKES